MKRSDLLKKKKKKKRLIIASILFSAITLTGAMTGLKNDDTDKTPSNTTKTANNLSIKKAHSKKAKKMSLKKSPKKKTKKKKNKLAKINTRIQDRLNESKGWALGELDENGHKTENGSPNPVFAWSILVKKIVYKKNNRLEVYVDSKFNDLSNQSKSKVILTAQNSALSEVGEIKKFNTQQYQEGLFTQVFCDGNHVGRSHLVDYKDFKWDKT